MTMCDAYRLLASIRRKLTVQQYRTIRGQLRAGDVEGAVRGINRLIGGNDDMKMEGWEPHEETQN